jgi:hypothetical protein
VTGLAENPALPAGEDAARLESRHAGYCVLCDAIVERAGDGGCPAGHPAEAVTGGLELLGGEPLPRLGRFNLAAFLMPPIWGPAHGQWVGAVFLPIWLFADSALRSAIAGGIGQRIAASVVVAATLAFEFAFAQRGNGLAFRRVIGRTTVERFAKRQLAWAIAMIPLAAALLSWAAWFDVTRR